MTRSRRLIPSLVALLGASACLPSTAPALAGDLAPRCAAVHPDVRYSKIEALIHKQYAADAATALTLGIVEHGCLQWIANFGTMGPGSSAAPTADSIYPIASVSKMITGIMFLQLVDRGVLHFTDPAVRYVPELDKARNPYPWAPPVTLIQLATMTSGVTAEQWTAVPNHFPSADTNPATWEARLAEQIPKTSYHFEPGTRREYSNEGYAILGLALGRAAHRAYTEYVESEILKPLGMADTSFAITETSAARFAYAPHDMPALPSWLKHPELPAAGLFTTLNDLVKLMRFQMGLGPETVLTHQELTESLRLVVPSDAQMRYGDGVGYSVVRNPDSDLVALGHGGQTWNYMTSYEFDRSTLSGIIVLAADRSNDYKPLVRRGLKILNPHSSGGTALGNEEEH